LARRTALVGCEPAARRAIMGGLSAHGEYGGQSMPPFRPV